RRRAGRATGLREVEVEVDGPAGLPGDLDSAERRAARWLDRQTGARDLESGRGGDGRRQHVADVESEVGGVVSVEDEREPVGRFDAEDDGAAPPAGLDGHEARVYPLPAEEGE